MMKRIFGLFGASAGFATLLATVSSCSMACIEDGSGTHCSAKSLQRFDGAPPPPQQLDVVAGAPITIDVLYGNVSVQRSSSNKLEVQFSPFVYAGYDEKASADRQLAENLRLSATASGGITVSVARQGGTNGLGADTVVRIPDQFDGGISIVNRGDGPLNNFDVKVDFVGRASSIGVIDEAILGNCWIQGAPTVRNTSVKCAEDISVMDVSDDVTIDNSEESHSSGSPAITLRLAGTSPNSHGGKITSTSGTISASFPRGGGYVLHGRSPVKGMIQEGSLPPGCTVQGSPNDKTVTCGRGPTYELLAGAQPDYVGPPENSNVQLAYH